MALDLASFGGDAPAREVGGKKPVRLVRRLCGFVANPHEECGLMLTVGLQIGELTERLKVRYSTLGRPRELTPLAFSFPVSNSLFLYTATGGRFILKAMAESASLYGHADVRNRLEVVGRTLADLRRAGLPVEQIVCGDDGRYVDQYDDHLLRLYVFDQGRAFSGTKDDSWRGARALRRLHAEGLSCLGPNTRADLMQLGRTYPLCDTATQLPRLRLFVAERADASPTFATILDHWDTIEWAVDRALAVRSLEPEPVCLVHSDFHPRNALFQDGADEAAMIDFDNMRIGGRLTCLGFTILRFAFYQRDRTPEAVRDAIALFAGEECADPEFMERLIHAMVFLEIEKVLRILYRVSTTGQYTAFLNNICPLHVANIDLLRASFIRD
jgi:Ser/Thr protein kinase RdoA (MazF antagonist)